MARDLLQEAMDAMVDLSLPDIEALRKAADLMKQSDASDMSKAFTLGFSMDMRAAAKAQLAAERK